MTIMQYAIVHRMSGNVLEKHEASSADECREAYLKYHPELECDTYTELEQRYPTLIYNLFMIPLN